MQTKNKPSKPSMLQDIYGGDYDLVYKKRYASLADEIMDNLCLVGVVGTTWEVVVEMLRNRLSPKRIIPPAKAIAAKIGRSYRHVLGIIAVLKAQELLSYDRKKGYDLSPLIRKIKNLLKHKDPTPIAPLASRPAPRPRPAPVPTPAPDPDPLPPAALVEEAAEIDEDEITTKLVEKTEMSGIMARHPVGSGPWRLAHRRWKYLDDWLRRYAPVLAAAALGGA